MKIFIKTLDFYRYEAETNIKHFSDNDEINQFFKGVCHISQLKINIFEKISSPLICIFQDAFFDVYHAHIKNFFLAFKGTIKIFFKKEISRPVEVTGDNSLLLFLNMA